MVFLFIYVRVQETRTRIKLALAYNALEVEYFISGIIDPIFANSYSQSTERVAGELVRIACETGR